MDDERDQEFLDDSSEDYNDYDDMDDSMDNPAPERVSGAARQHIDNLKDAHKRRVQAAEERARNSLARARTDAERKQAIEKLKQEKLNAERELYEAKAATNRAKAAVLKARKESGDVGIGQRLAKEARSLGASFGGVSKQISALSQKQQPKKVVAKRKPLRRAAKPKSEQDEIHKMLWG